jgi:hypothetical protein
VPTEFLARLREFVKVSSASADALYFPAFGGHHTCEFCGKEHDSRNFGIPSGDLLFIAPAMVAHYIEQHGYSPPAEFISAVLASPLPDTAEYGALCSRFHQLHERRMQELMRIGGYMNMDHGP